MAHNQMPTPSLSRACDKSGQALSIVQRILDFHTKLCGDRRRRAPSAFGVSAIHVLDTGITQQHSQFCCPQASGSSEIGITAAPSFLSVTNDKDYQRLLRLARRMQSLQRRDYEYRQQQE